MTGIGFLGAGAIIQQGLNVRGLTTAASLWVTAAIGTAVGLGYYVGSLATVGIALVALAFLKPVEQRLINRLSARRHRIALSTQPEFRVGELRGALTARDIRVAGFRIDEEEGENLRYLLNIHLPRGTPVEDALRLMRSVSGVVDASVYD